MIKSVLIVLSLIIMSNFIIDQEGKNRLQTSKGSTIQGKPFTSTHIFIAQYEGSKFYTCLGRTAACPRDCENSGNMATFKVLKYIKFIPNSQSGTEKLQVYSIRTSDYYKKDLTDKYVSVIKKLKKGDVVTLHIEYIYDTTKDAIYAIQKVVSITKKS